MRTRTLFAIPVIVTGWLAACSKPASENGQNPPTSQTQGARDIQLAVPAASEVSLVSALEAGRSLKGTQTHQVVRARETAVAQTTALVAEPVPTLSEASISPPDIPQVSAPMPMPMAPAPVLDRPSVSDGSGYLPPTLPRDPTIIIRGGRGGLDPCDLHRLGGHGPGMAINRRAPSFGGGPGGMSSFPRSGIR